MSATLTGAKFKELIGAVSKFPSVGSFAGSELVAVEVKDGKAIATAFDLVLARAKVEAEGELELSSVDERVLVSFSSLCPDGAKVVFERLDGALLVRCRRREINVPLGQAVRHKIPALKDVPGLKIDKTTAASVAYLSSVAYNDMSRPELCCVMLTTNGEAVASSHKTAALLKAPSKITGNVAVPLILARAFVVGDVLYSGVKETVLKSGIALYSVPSAVRAQKEFPLALIKQLGKLGRAEVCTIDGEKLALAVTECAKCLGQLARTEIIATLSIGKDLSYIAASNGGVQYKEDLRVVSEKEQNFHIPLDGLVQVAPFLAGNIVLARGAHGELFVQLAKGWIMLAELSTGKKHKKKNA